MSKLNKQQTVIRAPNALIEISKTQSSDKISKPKKSRRRQRKPKKQEMSLPTDVQLTEHGKRWLEVYTFPTSIINSENDILERNVPRNITHLGVPDAAMIIHAVYQHRVIETIVPPFLQKNVVDTTGRNYSMLIMQQPLFRALMIILVHKRSAEFDTTVMSSFSRAWASIPDRETARYPNWVPCDLFDLEDDEFVPILYFTVVASPGLVGIPDPDSVGTSSTFSQFRFTSEGFHFNHNTPELFNQGTYVCANYNCSIEPFVYTENHVRGFDYFYLHCRTTGPLSVLIEALVNGESPDVLALLEYEGVLPSPVFTANISVRNAAATFVLLPTHEFQYDVLGTQIRLVNLTNATVQIIGVNLPGTYRANRLYSRIDAVSALTEPITPSRTNLNKITLPPCTQSQLAFGDPYHTSGLLQDGGFTLANRIFNVLFLLQNALNFAKTVFVSDEEDLPSLADTSRGFRDSFDVNFGFAMANLQNVPYAAAPFIHYSRTDEYVPGVDSFVGGFASQCESRDDLAVEAGISVGAQMPHGLNGSHHDYSSFLPSLTSIINGLPEGLQRGGSLAMRVGQVLRSLVGPAKAHRRSVKA